MRKLAPLLIGSLALFSAPAAAQMEVATTDQIRASYEDCFKVTQSGSIDLAPLAKLGWSRTTSQGSPNNPIEADDVVFSHKSRAPLLIFKNESGAGACVINARIENLDTYAEFLSGFDNDLLKPNLRGEVSLPDKGHPIQVSPAGISSQPAMRISVGTPTETK